VRIGQGLNILLNHCSMFHSMNHNTMQMFLLLDKDEGALIL
jgi:hypothetical protein